MNLSKHKPVFSLIFSILLLTSCNIPRDPNKSWEQAKNNSLRIGIVNKKPSALKQKDSISLSEIQFIRDFSKEYNLKTTFTEDNESALVEKLENFELDLVLGDFKKNTIWKAKAGPIKSFDDKHVILVAQGENKLVYKLEEYIHKIKKNGEL
tara:strand:- start:305 stop:760 length:456 start_codon:yes stop_codon:yes gene_type:complete